jgi:glycosyltransferase involved in cell wall biosynthesis
MAPLSHILHLNTNAAWGGGEYQVLQLALGTRAHGLGCTLCALEGGALAARAAAAGLAVIPLPRHASLRMAAALVARAGGTLLHAHDSAGLALGGAVARRLGLPLVYTRRIASPLRRNPFSRFKYSPRRVARVIAISETVRRAFLASSRYPAERVGVVRSGLDLAALSTVAPDPALRAFAAGGVLAGGVGKLSAKKNWSFLLRTAAALRRAGHDDWRWVIAGEGSERPALEREIARLDLGKRVRLLGFRDDGARVLRSLDLLFFPSRAEGAGVTVMEAMALDVAVVAVRSEGVAETLGACGLLVEDGDEAGAAAAVLRLRDAAQRSDLTAAARAWVGQRHDIRDTVRGNLAVYRELAAGA